LREHAEDVRHRLRYFIYGGSGSDLYLGDFSGRDYIAGGMGDDLCLDTRDGRGGDTVNGGPGMDVYVADSADTVISAKTDTSSPCGD